MPIFDPTLIHEKDMPNYTLSDITYTTLEVDTDITADFKKKGYIDVGDLDMTVTTPSAPCTAEKAIKIKFPEGDPCVKPIVWINTYAIPGIKTICNYSGTLTSALSPAGTQVAVGSGWDFYNSYNNPMKGTLVSPLWDDINNESKNLRFQIQGNSAYQGGFYDRSLAKLKYLGWVNFLFQHSTYQNDKTFVSGGQGKFESTLGNALVYYEKNGSLVPLGWCGEINFNYSITEVHHTVGTPMVRIESVVTEKTYEITANLQVTTLAQLGLIHNNELVIDADNGLTRLAYKDVTVKDKEFPVIIFYQRSDGTMGFLNCRRAKIRGTGNIPFNMQNNTAEFKFVPLGDSEGDAIEFTETNAPASWVRFPLSINQIIV